MRNAKRRYGLLSRKLSCAYGVVATRAERSAAGHGGATMSEHGRRYACGLVREDGKTLIVSAGLGTSVLPLRMGARPDMWLIALRP